MNTAALLLSLALTTPPPSADDLVLRAVHVVDVEHGEVLRDRAVVVRGDRIAAVVPDAELEVPAGARVVDGAGGWVIPGLFDMHVHLHPRDGTELFSLYLAHGVTTVQSMHGGDFQLGLRAAVAAGEVVGPRIFTTGPTTARLGVHTVEQAREVVREQVAAGYDAIKMYGDGANSMPEETYATLLAEARAAGIRVVGHAPRNLPFDVVLENGQASIDHMEEVVYTAPGLARLVGPYVDLQFGRAQLDDHPALVARVPDFAAELADEVAALADAARDAGLAVTPTLTTFGAIAAMAGDGLADLLAAPERRWDHPLRRRAWTPERNRFRNGGWSRNLPFFAEYLRRNHELQGALVRAFHDAGVPILAGTDAPFDLVTPGASLHDELAAFVACGLSELDALRTATLAPARFLGLADSGRIAPGARADLVLLRGDPLASIGNTRTVAGVALAGRWLPGAELAAELDALVERHRCTEARSEALVAALAGDDPEPILAAAHGLRDDPYVAAEVEARVNALGYERLRAGRTLEAVATFLHNTEAFPAAANTWDSLGEAFLTAGWPAQAIEHYERSLALDPGNANARRMIERCRAALAR